MRRWADDARFVSKGINITYPHTHMSLTQRTTYRQQCKSLRWVSQSQFYRLTSDHGRDCGARRSCACGARAQRVEKMTLYFIGLLCSSLYGRANVIVVLQSSSRVTRRRRRGALDAWRTREPRSGLLNSPSARSRTSIARVLSHNLLQLTALAYVV